MAALGVAGVIVIPMAGHASVPAAPTEVAVVPAGLPLTPPVETVVYAGTTGYLHRRDNSQTYLWTRYADGQTTTVTALAGANPSPIQPAGGDHVAIPTESSTRS